ncbi:c-type cytochrome [Gammaproteobacteria bacterium]|nr:c-type cytochrome [Gammaproteobacteria bacterium]
MTNYKLFGITFSTTMLSIFVVVGSLQAAEIESSIARGAKLYDKWYKVIDVEAPSKSHSLYPTDKAYAEKPGSNWRCKECHGWDYRGVDGAYASGKHSTGIAGINGARDASGDSITATLKSDTHGYSALLSGADFTDLANFVSKGQVDMDPFIDRASKAPKGDAAKGEAYFNTICANCHGKDGKQPDDMKPFGAQMGNPWEVMHKILNGQPGEDMPALRVLDHQVIADIMSHMATLPKE